MLSATACVPVRATSFNLPPPVPSKADRLSSVTGTVSGIFIKSANLAPPDPLINLPVVLPYSGISSSTTPAAGPNTSPPVPLVPLSPTIPSVVKPTSNAAFQLPPTAD